METFRFGKELPDTGKDPSKNGNDTPPNFNDPLSHSNEAFLPNDNDSPPGGIEKLLCKLNQSPLLASMTGRRHRP